MARKNRLTKKFLKELSLKNTKEYWYKEIWKGKLVFTGLDIDQFNLSRFFEFSVLDLNTDTYRVVRYK